MAQILTIIKLKTKKDVGLEGKVVWDFTGEKSNSHGDGKANV